MGDLYSLHFFSCESARRDERLESLVERDEENKNWAYTGCFHAISALAILDFARFGGDSKISFSSFGPHVSVVDMHLTEEFIMVEFGAVILLGYSE